MEQLEAEKFVTHTQTFRHTQVEMYKTALAKRRGNVNVHTVQGWGQVHKGLDECCGHIKNNKRNDTSVE